jgi:SH3-like domain-containing protein
LSARRLIQTSLVLSALLISLSACSPFIIVESQGQPSQATEVWELITQAVQTEAPSETPASAYLPLTSAGDKSTPVAVEPVLVTQTVSRVRTGPGLNYADYYFLSKGVTLPILGRNVDSTWWAVPGPGDGSGPHGWISASIVIVQGDANGVPVLSEPPPTQGSTVLGNLGQPPNGNTCVVAHPGPGPTGPVNVYSAPQEASAVVAELGVNRWAPIIGAQSGWFQIQDASGLTGWVHESWVAFAGLCSAPGSGPSLPLVENPGAPPAGVCVASRPGQFPAPGIHRGPGLQYVLMARLENWAEVLKTENGWHQILAGPTEIGWVRGADVDLTGPCSGSEPDLPLIDNRGAPANDRCVAFLAAPGTEPLDVHAGPDIQAEVIALLGNWADVLGEQAGWFQIQIPQGGAGWVEGGLVDLSVGCP